MISRRFNINGPHKKITRMINDDDDLKKKSMRVDEKSCDLIFSRTEKILKEMTSFFVGKFLYFFFFFPQEFRLR